MTFKDELPVLISVESGKQVGKKWVTIRYAYMARAATIHDQDLVNWANRREAWMKEKGLSIRPLAPKPE